MQDRELYQKILGLEEPWRVDDVELSLDSGEIRVRISHPPETNCCCPECQRELACYDHGQERLWRHLDSCQFKTYLVAAPPRVECPEHGVKTARLPWAEPGSRFTILFERFAIDLLQATQTVKGAQEILRTNWDQTWNVVQRAVARGLERRQAKPGWTKFLPARGASGDSEFWLIAAHKKSISQGSDKLSGNLDAIGNFASSIAKNKLQNSYWEFS